MNLLLVWAVWGLFWFCCSIWRGNKHLDFLEFNNSASNGRPWFKGAVMYDRIAKHESSSPSIDFVRLFLKVWTNHTTCSLDCAFVGDVTLCSMFQLLVKVFELLWDELSTTIWNCTFRHTCFLWKIFLKNFWLHSDIEDSAVFWWLGTSWNNQQLEDCLNQVVPIHSMVFWQTARSHFAESLTKLGHI